MVKTYSQLIRSDDDRDFSAFTAVPDVGPAPALLVLQEIFGVNAFIRYFAERYAERGFLVLAPDLFWRLQPNADFAYSREGMKEARDILSRFDERAGVRDIRATAECARAMPECNGKVGAIGFCLGGKLAYSAAVDGSVDAAAGFYGVGIESDLVSADRIQCPLQLHFAGLDRLVSPSAVSSIRDALAPVVDIFEYKGADHGFLNDSRPSYHTDAASTGLARADALFARYLR